MSLLAEELDAETFDEIVPAALCRVSIITGNTQVDIGLPTDVPVAVLIPEILTLVRNRDRVGDRAFARAATVDISESLHRRWQLVTAHGSPLQPFQTLADVRTRNGDLLLLIAAELDTAAPLFDDVIDEAAAAITAHRSAWTAERAMWGGLLVFAVATAAAATLAVFTASHRDDLATTLFTATAAVTAIVLVATFVIARRREEPAAALVLGCVAITVSSACGVHAGLMLSGSATGAIALMLGLAAAGTCAVVVGRLGIGCVGISWVITAAVLGTIVVGCYLFAPGQRLPLAGTLAVVGLVTVSYAPRIAVAVARLALPRIPSVAQWDSADPDGDTAGEEVPVVVGVAAIATSARADDVTARALAGHAVATGVVGGGALAATAGALTLALHSRELVWYQAMFVVLVAVALCLRGRTHADAWQAGTLIGSGAVIALATAVSVGLGVGQWPLIALTAMVFIGLVAVLCGVSAPRSHFNPVQRRAAEIAEYVVLATLAPLCIWLWDLYAIVRNL